MTATIKLRNRMTGAAGGPTALRSGEAAWSGVDKVLYIGDGDDGSGNATVIRAIAGSEDVFTYDSRAAAEAANVSLVVQRINVVHNNLVLVYVRDNAGTALTTGDGQNWSPPDGYITPAHWGANIDGATDDKTYIDAALAHCAVRSAEHDWRVSMGKTLGVPVTLRGGNAVYAVSGQIDLEEANTGMIIDDMHITAVAGTWATSGGTATTERKLYRPQKSDFVFNAKANATFVTIRNCRLNLNNLCGGMKLRSRSYAINNYIAGCAGIGVHGASGDVWAIGNKVWQWTKQDAQFWDKDAYTGVGYFCGDTSSSSDMRVANCQAMWLHELVRFEDTNCNVWGGHFFNGPEDYLAADRAAFTTEEKAALDAYFGAGPDWDTYDFPVRTYHAGFVTSGTSNLNSKDASFSDVYLDNCHNEFYFDRVKLEGIRYGAKSSASPTGTPTYWNRFYCHTNGAYPECQITSPQILVETVTKQMYTFAADGGNTWGGTYSNFETSAINNFGSDLASGEWGDGLEMFKPRAFGCTEDFGDRGFPIITFVGPNNDGLIGMADANTTTDGSNNPESILFGAKGDTARIRARNGPVVIGNTSGALVGAEANATTVSTGDSGVTSVGVGVDDLILENNADVGMSLACPDANEGQIAFYDTSGKRGYLKSLPGGNLELNATSSVHVLSASAGAVTANANADNFVVEGTGNVGISILSPDASSSRIYFGSPSDERGADIQWNHATLTARIGTNATGGILDLIGGNGNVVASVDTGFRIGSWYPDQEGAELTISGGSITPTHGLHIVDTEGDAATDDLDTIAADNAAQGSRLTLTIADGARNVVVRDNVGNIRCGSNRTLDTTRDTISFIRQGNIWMMLSYASN